MPRLPSAPEPDALDVSPVPELDREAVEAALPREVRDALPALLEVWGVRISERWPHHPALADTLKLTAVMALAARHEARGLKHTAAVREACWDLGLAHDTVERRLRRWREAYLASRTKGQNVQDSPR